MNFRTGSSAPSLVAWRKGWRRSSAQAHRRSGSASRQWHRKSLADAGGKPTAVAPSSFSPGKSDVVKARGPTICLILTMSMCHLYLPFTINIFSTPTPLLPFGRGQPHENRSRGQIVGQFSKGKQICSSVGAWKEKNINSKISLIIFA